MKVTGLSVLDKYIKRNKQLAKSFSKWVEILKAIVHCVWYFSKTTKSKSFGSETMIVMTENSTVKKRY